MRLSFALLLVFLSCRSSSTQRRPPKVESHPESVSADDAGPIDEPALIRRADLDGLFAKDGFRGAFVAWEVGKAEAVCVGTEALCTRRAPPASTFKIPHALIGLELGILSGPEHPMKWDKKDRRIKAWNRDHTLRTAIGASAVWYFQRLSREIGRARMGSALAEFGYGNEVFGDAIDTFWLDGSLLISPLEQVQFWNRLLSARLPVQAESRAAVLAMAELERGDASRLVAKTGWYREAGKTDVGWLAGCLEGEGVWRERRSPPKTTSDTSVCFASIIEADEPFDHETFRKARGRIAREGLSALGYSVPTSGAHSR